MCTFTCMLQLFVMNNEIKTKLNDDTEENVLCSIQSFLHGHYLDKSRLTRTASVPHLDTRWQQCTQKEKAYHVAPYFLPEISCCVSAAN